MPRSDKRAIKRAGITPIALYSFRHKVTTILRQARVSEDEIAMWKGHKRPHLRTTGEWRIGSGLSRERGCRNRCVVHSNAGADGRSPVFSGHPETIRTRMENLPQLLKKPGAGEANRTPDPNLGKVMLYP